MKNEKYDVVIVGGGIIGVGIAYELSKYNLKTLLVEKNPYLASETTTGNSGVIHGGFDAEEDTLNAKLNVEGNRMWVEEIFPHLEFPRAKIDSLVIAFNKEEEIHLQALYKRGLYNGVNRKDLEIIDQATLRQLEPHINKIATKALKCTSSWAIDPVKATLCFAKVAINNGVEIRKNAAVSGIHKENGDFIVTLNGDEEIVTKNIINAAGHYADSMAAIAGYPDFRLKTRRGEYRILSASQAHLVNHICFKVPTLFGKGVVVAPMLQGTVLVGPTAEENVPKEDTRLVTQKKYDEIGKIGHDIIPSLNLEKTMIRIAGSRPIDKATDDFLIQYAKRDKNFINVAGMKSPAIAAAPAIFKMVARLLAENGTKLVNKKDFHPAAQVIW